MTEQLKGFRGTDYIQVRREDVEWLIDHLYKCWEDSGNYVMQDKFWSVRESLSAALSAEPVVSGLEWRIKGFDGAWFWTDDPAQVEKAKAVGAAIVPLSPVKQDPSITRAEWEAAQEALASLEAHSFYTGNPLDAGQLAVTVRKVLNRLPAAKEPPITEYK